MYRITVTSKGKHNNFEMGSRYSFSKKAIIKMAHFCEKEECSYIIYRFTYLCDGLWAWSKSGADEKLRKYFEEDDGE